MQDIPIPALPIGEEELRRAAERLREYKAAKAILEQRILEEERWYRLRHWEVIRGGGDADRPEPASAWLFNSIANKHADIMDNYPEPNVLPREQQDEADAQTLSCILPVILQRCGYEDTYDRSAWYKLKHGVCARGVFWNPELEEGMGDVDIRFIDMLNLFWEPGITDLQASRDLFVVELQDNEALEAAYPDLRGRLTDRVIEVARYANQEGTDLTGKSVVVDWYYKKRSPTGRTQLHYCKFVGDTLLFASENDPLRYPDGFYAHGRYPVELDVLFPEEGSPVGFGCIALMKSPQLYIDKLSQVILENTMMSARVRYLVKDGAGINDEEFLDWSRPLVKYAGDPDNLIPLRVQPVGGNVLNVLQMKISELKETSSNRDVSQGGSSGGVTAAAAIAALQEAGNKTSRDMIAASYRCFTRECCLAIELIRQFYSGERCFRITGEGGPQFVRWSADALRGRPLPPLYPGEEQEPDYAPVTRRPVFDVEVRPQKRSPYSKMAQNELAKELYRLGFFAPRQGQQSLAALELMDFDGKEKVRAAVLRSQVMAAAVPVEEPPVAKGRAKASVPKTDPNGRPAMTAYGQELAKRARVSME